jgi:hypothetical protein
MVLHNKVPHSQVDDVHSKTFEHFIQILVQKVKICHFCSLKKFVLEVVDSALSSPSLTLVVGMFTDGFDSAVKTSARKSLLGTKQWESVSHGNRICRSW